MEPDPARSSELAILSESARQQALERYRLLRPCVEQSATVSAVARASGVALRTLRRWRGRYRRQGLAGLARSPRADRGKRRRVSETLVQFIQGLALQKPPPTAANVQRKACEIARQRGEPLPSYSTVYAILRRLEPGLLTLAHQGSRAYSEAYDLLFRREADRPNAVWQADHTLLDILLLNERGQTARPWLTVILDDYSRAVAGYFLSFCAPCILHTALALRQAIWRKTEPSWMICGIPAVLYADHGSDFRSRHLEQVAADLKMQAVFSLPGVPRGRGKIERFFETITQMLLARLPGYAPAGSTEISPALTLSELDVRFRRFVLEEYHTRIHSETGQAPRERWEEGGFLPQMPPSLEQLDLLLLTVAKARRVQRDGIHFQGMRYLDLTLSAYVGEEVIVRYDPRDMAEIRVFHCNQFLCRAVCQELAGQTIGLKDIVQARNERRRRLRKTLSQRATLVDALLGRREEREAEGQETPPPAAQESPTAPPRTRLKRYENE